jgi:hypothetical protein
VRSLEEGSEDVGLPGATDIGAGEDLVEEIERFLRRGPDAG